MKTLLFVIASLLVASIGAQANELDRDSAIANQNQRAPEVSAPTLVMKVDAKGNVSTLKSEKPIELTEATKAQLADSKFEKVSELTKEKLGELDRDHSSASWYFVSGYWGGYTWGGYYAPSYYYPYYYNACYGYYCGYAPVYYNAGYVYGYAAPYFNYYWGGSWYYGYRPHWGWGGHGHHHWRF